MSLKRKRSVLEAMESGVFSDVTLILSDGSELTCHRIMLRSCDFFKNALEPGGFQESLTGIIDMKNDPPRAVRRVVEYLYTGDYSLPGQTDEPHAVDDEERDDDDEKFEPEIKQYRRRMANMTPREFANAVVAHAEVYVMSVYYLLPELKEKAASCIKAALSIDDTDSVLDVFPQLVGVVHPGVPTEICSLHKDLIKFARDNVSALTSGPTFQKMVDNSTEFTEKIMHELAAAKKPTELKVERLEKRVSELKDQLDAILGESHSVGCMCDEGSDLTFWIECPRCKRIRLAGTKKQYRWD
ncbi:hypothetical protein SLS58_011087 [Diplodia intermedia]|uniref:BTB domain-containing protein n=1 Tax=Diplodia intermedia TaxID=856260 RepID=A0ABR3T297_9PEZI